MSTWVDRIARARALSQTHPAAAAILNFYAELAGYQRALRPSARQAASEDARDFATAIDLGTACKSIPSFLTWLGRHAPAPLADAARDAISIDTATWTEMMHRRLAHVELDGPLAFVVDAVLQPFAEAAVGRPATGAEGQPPSGLACCPMCGSPPVVAALKEEGQGAKRVLLCSLCSTEWDYLRVVCPACDEKRFDALPVFTSEAVAHVRIDACDSCRVYLKTVDLSKDGLAIPAVDDIATIALDLWAREAGYTRLHPNLLRL